MIDQILKTSLELATFFYIKDVEYGILEKEADLDETKNKKIIVTRNFNTRKIELFTIDNLEKKNPIYYREKTTNDIIKEYLLLSEDKESENIEYSNFLCGDLGIDQGDGNSIMFLDGTKNIFEKNDNVHMLYKDEDFIVMDGEDYDLDCYVIIKTENFK